MSTSDAGDGPKGAKKKTGKPGPLGRGLLWLGRAWDSRTSAGQVGFWWIFGPGALLTALTVGLYVVSALVLGSFGEAYDVLVGIDSPRKSSSPGLAYVLSVWGWLLVPAVIGGAAGFAVERSIQAHRSGDPTTIGSHGEGR